MEDWYKLIIHPAVMLYNIVQVWKFNFCRFNLIQWNHQMNNACESEMSIIFVLDVSL